MEKSRKTCTLRNYNGICTIFGNWGGTGLKALYKTLTGFATYIDPSRANTVCGMAKWLGMKLNMTEAVAETFGVGVNYLFFFGMILMFFWTKKKWQESLFLTAILVHFIPSNYEYTSVYYLLVLMLFLKENAGCFCDKKIGQRIYLAGHGIAFALFFSADFLMIYYRYGLISGMFTIMYLMIAVNIVNVFWNMIKDYKNRVNVMMKED